MSSPKARYIVLSDMHFGTPESSINSAAHRSSLVSYIVEHAPWAEIIFTGDLLDVNLSTLTRAIEGRHSKKPRLCGFRDFLQEIDAAMASVSPGTTLKDVAERWVYVPGNHDYKVWDIMASKVVCEDVLASGLALNPAKMPLARHAWRGDTSFFAGLFRRFGAQDRVLIEYPDHRLSFAGGEMLLTHGHYLDPSQTRGHDLVKNFAKAGTPRKRKELVRSIVIQTAQYQVLANAVSFTPDATRITNDLVGPDGWVHKLKRFTTTVAAGFLGFFVGREAALRGEQISDHLAENIECYVEHFQDHAPLPRWFVFGHTHVQGHKETRRLHISAYNVGSCYPDREMPVTFLQVDQRADGSPEIELMCMDAKAKIAVSPWHVAASAGAGQPSAATAV